MLAEKALAFESDVSGSLRQFEATATPTMAVPVLEDGARLWESDLIIDYLLRTYPDAKPPSSQQRTVAAVALAGATGAPLAGHGDAGDDRDLRLESMGEPAPHAG